MERLRQLFSLLLVFSAMPIAQGLSFPIQKSLLQRRECSTLSSSRSERVTYQSNLLTRFSQTLAVSSMVLSISIQHVAATSPSIYRNPTTTPQYTTSRERLIDVRNTPLSLQCPVVGEWKTLRTGAKIVARKYSKRLKVARIGAKLGVARSAMFCRLSLIRAEAGDQ